MSDVTLSYKGSDILELSDSGSATLKTGGTYCDADIELAYTKPSGGGSSTPTTVTIATTTNNYGAYNAIRSATGFNSFFCINTSATSASGEYMLYGGTVIQFPLANATNFALDIGYRKNSSDQYAAVAMTTTGSTVVRSGDVFKVWSLDFLEESYEQDN